MSEEEEGLELGDSKTEDVLSGHFSLKSFVMERGDFFF